MQYTRDNFIASLYIEFAAEMRERGWNIFWHASGETEAFTGGTEQGTLTLIQAIPVNPTFIVGTSASDYTDQTKIVVPAFAIQVMMPRRMQRIGLGHTDWEREVDIIISGLATDARQQSTIASDIYDWLQIDDDDYYLPINDYTTPNAPVALDPAEVWWANVKTTEDPGFQDPRRYQIHTDLTLRYVE